MFEIISLFTLQATNIVPLMMVMLSQKSSQYSLYKDCCRKNFVMNMRHANSIDIADNMLCY